MLVTDSHQSCLHSRSIHLAFDFVNILSRMTSRMARTKQTGIKKTDGKSKLLYIYVIKFWGGVLEDNFN